MCQQKKKVHPTPGGIEKLGVKSHAWKSKEKEVL